MTDEFVNRVVQSAADSGVKGYLTHQDKKGNYLIRDLIKAAADKEEGGFFKYYYPKPGSEEALPKLSK